MRIMRLFAVVVLLGWAACGGGGAAGKGGTARPTGPAASGAGPVVAGAASSTPRTPARLLATVDAPVGDIRIAVHAGELHDGRRCWTYVTEGLAGRDHPELVLSLLLRAADDPEGYDAEPLKLLGQLAVQIPGPHRWDPWRSATLGAGMFGRTDVIGLAAVPRQGPDGLRLPERAVTLVPLTREETEVARDHGAARVAGSLGRRERFYPTVWWFDRDRTSLFSAKDLRATKLAGMVGERTDELSFILDVGGDVAIDAKLDDRGLPTARAGTGAGLLHLRVAPSVASEVARGLRAFGKAGGILAIVNPDELAGGRLTWVPGSDAGQIITGPSFSGHITGNFVVLMVDPSEPGATLLEDGAIVRMTPAERDAVATALEAGREHRIAAHGDALAWQVELVRPPSRTRALQEVRLETPEDEIARRVAPGDLVAFMDAVERELTAALAAAGTPATARRLDVFLTLRRGKREVRLVPSPADTGPWIAALERRIAGLPPVVVSDEVKLVAVFEVRSP